MSLYAKYQSLKLWIFIKTCNRFQNYFSYLSFLSKLATLRNIRKRIQNQNKLLKCSTNINTHTHTYQFRSNISNKRMPTFKPTSKIEFSKKNGKALIYLARQKVKIIISIHLHIISNEYLHNL